MIDVHLQIIRQALRARPLGTIVLAVALVILGAGFQLIAWTSSESLGTQIGLAIVTGALTLVPAFFLIRRLLRSNDSIASLRPQDVCWIHLDYVQQEGTTVADVGLGNVWGGQVTVRLPWELGKEMVADFATAWPWATVGNDEKTQAAFQRNPRALQRWTPGEGDAVAVPARHAVPAATVAPLPVTFKELASPTINADVLGAGTLEVASDGLRVRGQRRPKLGPGLAAGIVAFLGLVFGAILITTLGIDHWIDDGKSALLFAGVFCAAPGFVVYEQLKKRLRGQALDVSVPWSRVVIVSSDNDRVHLRIGADDLAGDVIAVVADPGRLAALSAALAGPGGAVTAA